jgi:type VI secretion system secreted protein Hcp
LARSDMFMKATGSRSGVIEGESNDRSFAGQIELIDWSWSAERSGALAAGGGRAVPLTLGAVKIVKRVDRATTALLHAMSTNEVLKTVEVRVRKSGGTSPLPYFLAKLTEVRVAGYDLISECNAEGAPELRESLTLAFTELTFEYTPQTGTGSGGAASAVTLMHRSS